MGTVYQPISVSGQVFENAYISRKRSPFNDVRLHRVWQTLTNRMVECQSIVVQQLATNTRESDQYYGFLNNKRVMIEELIKYSCDIASSNLVNRSILILGDSSSFNLNENKGRIEDIDSVGYLNGGKIKGFHGHPNLAISPEGNILGLADIILWNRPKSYREQTDRKLVPIEEKEYYKWQLGAQNAHQSTLEAANRTFIYDREADSYELFKYIQQELADDFIIRAKHNRSIVHEGDNKLLDACLEELESLGEYEFDLPALNYLCSRRKKRIKRTARKALIQLKATKVAVEPPQRFEGQASLDLYIVEAKEVGDNIPEDEPPVYWKLWTTHPVTCFEQARLIVFYYTLRWIIEQFFRTLKSKGFRVESTQMGSFNGILRQTTMAMKAAVTVLQLVYARNKQKAQPTSEVFDQEQQEVLQKVNEQLEGKTKDQKNPFQPEMLSWAAWIIARLGGWKGYRSQKPAGPSTIKKGLEKFYSYMEMYKIINSTQFNFHNTT